MNPSLSEVLSMLEQLTEKLSKSESADCDITISQGDWGGQMAVISLSPSGCAYLAMQLLKLVQHGNPGTHFHEDKAGTAINSDDQLVFSLKLD